MEKYIKAFLILHQIPFPKTHDIERLLVLVERENADLAAELYDCPFLSPYAAEMRYPGDRPEAAEEDANRAFSLMHSAKNAILAALGQ